MEECPICHNKKWSYVCYTEECWGIVEQRGRCDRCGFIIEQAYSNTVTGFERPQRRGYKRYGNWFGKNIRQRKRLKRKYNIKYDPKDRYIIENV